ncbi:MAG: FAD-binding protein [Verrucomicrobiales bacterium]|jgi:glycolate oxidase subunit GlcD|nr:FAD-binding protein [Verrucomicrobiales bacterium]
MNDLSWIPALTKLLGKATVSVAEDARREHGGDAWFAHAMPDAVVTPRTVSAVQKLMRFCHARRIPVTPRGAGRGYVGGCVPVAGGVSLSLKKLNRIRAINAADSVATVEPGVITSDLQSAVKKLGLFYPPDPASARESSIGGNLATNAGGPRCLKYGVTRNYALGLDIVLVDGRLVHCGGRAHKNKLGFNLADLFIGSEGMLGVIVGATLRLIPLPPARAVLVANFARAPQAAAAVNAIIRAGFLPAALEVADQFTLAAARAHRPGAPAGDALLLVEIDGQKKSVAGETRALEKILRDCRALTVSKALTDAAAEQLWNIRRDFSHALKATGLAKLNEDIVVPRGKLVDLFNFAEKLQKKFTVNVACFGHAGDGNIHVNLMVPPADARAANSRRALNALFKQILAWRGSITGEHGIGLAKKPWWPLATDRDLRALHQTVKRALDPRGILNPGKFLG